MDADIEGLVTVVFTVADLDRSEAIYRTAFGLDLHLSDHGGSDGFTTGRHAAISWPEPGFMHFALYEAGGRPITTAAQIALRVGDLDFAHRRAVAAGIEVVHGPQPQPWGRSARYRDPDGNVIELTSPG